MPASNRISSRAASDQPRLRASAEAASVATLLSHYQTAVLPPWTGAGWNAALALPYEALDGATGQPLPPQRYRAMACARQLYVFSLNEDFREHADRLFASLCRYFADPEGGWFYSIDPAGQPLDTGKDLYTHAFVVFACAAYWRASGNGLARQALDDTVQTIETRFALPEGQYHAALQRDFTARSLPLQQNPVMHLTEAYLAARDATGSAWFADRLAEIGAGVLRTFVDPDTGCIWELPRGAADNRIEPGHQFEWYALMAMAPDIFGESPLSAHVARGCAFAQRHGVVAATQGVVAAIDGQGRVLDRTERIWAQTEYGRALALRNDNAGGVALRQWLRRFPVRFLHERGWNECIAEDGSVLRADMPSTTPYHLATAWQALRSRSAS
ncbi:AGE family epimerase/isomerase [Cupriavidus sp. AU9028]|uniref:AGE family epimerase/isomerase n=1 Tax=Cupriavidus sp. AU9028 TaxID=2871157 RepID=UPI001C94E219|nr:AGE family epimerase/isomerase [Cupriavidus sp. AU9028]MBY4896043.1 AGE family epimerase/isomerase [Cupriavidus sp. AU9028]